MTLLHGAVDEAVGICDFDTGLAHGTPVQGVLDEAAHVLLAAVGDLLVQLGVAQHSRFAAIEPIQGLEAI
jgi:hypothetical protein